MRGRAESYGVLVLAIGVSLNITYSTRCQKKLVLDLLQQSIMRHVMTDDDDADKSRVQRELHNLFRCSCSCS